MRKQTLEEWRAEAKERFGENADDWRFVCPRCGNEQTPLDFVQKAGMKAEYAANTSYQGCIGREVQGIGCDWAAYGLFGTLGKGRIIMAPNGEEVEVFDFAPAQEK